MGAEPPGPRPPGGRAAAVDERLRPPVGRVRATVRVFGGSDTRGWLARRPLVVGGDVFTHGELVSAIIAHIFETTRHGHPLLVFVG